MSELVSTITFEISSAVIQGLLPVGPPELQPVLATLRSIRLRDLPLAARAVSERHGFGQEVTGFCFPTDLEEGEPPLDGVRFFFFEDTVDIDLAAFDALMQRFFEAMHELAATPAARAKS